MICSIGKNPFITSAWKVSRKKIEELNCDLYDYYYGDQELGGVQGNEMLVLTPKNSEHSKYDLCKHSKFRHKMYGIKMDRNISQSFDLFPVVVLRASTTIFIC